MRNDVGFGKHQNKFRLLDSVHRYQIREHSRALFQLLPRAQFTTERTFQNAFLDLQLARSTIRRRVNRCVVAFHARLKLQSKNAGVIARLLKISTVEP